MTLFDNWPFNPADLPSNLYSVIQILEEERQNNGVETTPDETADLIEVLFLTIGRLSMAELWYATSHDILPIENKSVLSLLLDARDIHLNPRLTMGKWVGLSRKISELFNEHNIPMQLQGLDSIHWGRPIETTNTINQLVAFRNRFAHGSFSAPVDIIESHYRLLIKLFEQISGLYTQSIVALAPEFGIQTTTIWSAGKPTSIDVSPPSSSTNTVWLCISADKSIWMELSPFFMVEATDVGLQFQLSNFSMLSAEYFFNSAKLSTWQARYNTEYQGSIHRNISIQNRDTAPLPPTLQMEIENTLSEHNTETIHIVGYPGTGLHSILPHMIKQPPVQFPTVIFWDVQNGDLTQSGTVLLNKLETTFELPTQNHKLTIDQRIERLKSAFEKTALLLAVDGLEYANTKYRYESHSILDIVNLLVDTKATILLISFFTDSRQQLFYDKQIVWDSSRILNTEKFKFETNRLSKTLLESTILSVLSDTTHSLFSLCDRLDTVLNTLVFEPEIEYALWHLRPLLKTTVHLDENGTATRQWTTFSSEVLP